MDPKLSEQLQQLLVDLLKNAQDAASWVSGQIPLLLKEKLNYDFYESLFYVLLATALFIVAGWTSHYALKYGGEWLILMVVPLGLSSIGLFVTLLTNVPLMVKISLAPRLYIVEWLMQMVKK